MELTQKQKEHIQKVWARQKQPNANVHWLSLTIMPFLSALLIWVFYFDGPTLLGMVLHWGIWLLVLASSVVLIIMWFGLLGLRQLEKAEYDRKDNFLFSAAMVRSIRTSSLRDLIQILIVGGAILLLVSLNWHYLALGYVSASLMSELLYRGISKEFYKRLDEVEQA